MGDIITFDEHHHIRVLDTQKSKDSDSLQRECTQFITKATQFDKVSKNIITLLETKAKLIEEEKLKAIGKRIQVERQAELRKRKQRELQALINEKQAELDRYTIEHESLLRLEAEQRALLDKLSNNEV